MYVTRRIFIVQENPGIIGADLGGLELLEGRKDDRDAVRRGGADGVETVAEADQHGLESGLLHIPELLFGIRALAEGTRDDIILPLELRVIGPLELFRRQDHDLRRADLLLGGQRIPAELLRGGDGGQPLPLQGGKAGLLLCLDPGDFREGIALQGKLLGGRPSRQGTEKVAARHKSRDGGQHKEKESLFHTFSYR